jgi:hypothetical protein
MPAAPEIGSEFSLDPSPSSGGWLDVLPSDSTLLRSGRDGLRAILRTLHARGRRRLVAGAFLCDALLQAAEGWQIDLVPVDEHGLPRADALLSVARDAGDQGVLLAVPLFGAPWSKALAQVAGMARAFGLEVVEDRTHSLFGGFEPIAPIGFASLRKWFALPDGGAAWGLATGAMGDPDQGLVSLREDAMSRKQAYLESGRGKKADFLNRLAAAEELLDTTDDVAAMSMVSRQRLGEDLVGLRARRRANFERLWHGLPSSMLPLVPALGPDTVPLGLPITTPHRDALKAHLIRRRIYPAWHWQLPARVDARIFTRAASIADTVLTLVCDQRYGPEDMDRTLTALRGFKP